MTSGHHFYLNIKSTISLLIAGKIKDEQKEVVILQPNKTAVRFWAIYLSCKLQRYKEIQRTAQIRISVHRLSVETGRHEELRESVVNRTCFSCCERERIEALAQLPNYWERVSCNAHMHPICRCKNEARPRKQDMSILSTSPHVFWGGCSQNFTIYSEYFQDKIPQVHRSSEKAALEEKGRLMKQWNISDEHLNIYF